MFCGKEICTEPTEQWNYEIQGVQREKLSVFPCILLLILNPFAPGDFAEKHVLKLAEWFSGHYRAIKS